MSNIFKDLGFKKNISGEITSPSAERLSGYTKEEFQTILGILPPDIIEDIDGQVTISGESLPQTITQEEGQGNFREYQLTAYGVNTHDTSIIVNDVTHTPIQNDRTFTFNELTITYGSGVDTSDYSAILLRMFDENGDRREFTSGEFTWERISGTTYQETSYYNHEFVITNPKNDEVEAITGTGYVYGAYASSRTSGGYSVIKYTFNEPITISDVDVFFLQRANNIGYFKMENELGQTFVDGDFSHLTGNKFHRLSKIQKVVFDKQLVDTNTLSVYVDGSVGTITLDLWSDEF